MDDDAILGKLAREYNRNQQEIDRIRGELEELGPAFLDLGRTLSELQAHNWEQEVIRQINVSGAALRINFSGRSSQLPLTAIEKTSRLVVELSNALKNKKRMEKNLKKKGLGSIMRP